MNGFPDKRFIISIFLIVQLLFVAGPLLSNALAEQIGRNVKTENRKLQSENAPVQLIPSVKGPARYQQGNNTTKREGPKGYTPVSPSDRTSAPVAVHTLKDLDTDSVGVLDESRGGLGAEMWLGTSRSFVTRAIALLPSRVRSPTMRNLMRRLLLTQAVAPKRKQSQPALLPLRVGALFEIGDLKSALALIASTSGSPSEEYLARIGVEGRLFGNDTAGACQMVQAYRDGFKDIYWQKAAAFCLAMAGKNAEANLISDVLAERSETVHPAFFAAMDKLSGADSPTINSLKAPSALLLSLMRSAGLGLPEDVIEKASPSALRAICLSPNASLDLRLVAAELAMDIGMLDGKILGEIYNAVTFDPTAIANPIQYASKNWGTGGRALLVQAAGKIESASARADLIERALKLARQRGEWKITALAMAPLVAALKPTLELAKFSRVAVRVLLLSADMKLARKWLELANDKESNTGQKSALWPLKMLMSKNVVLDFNSESFRNWWQSKEDMGTGFLSKARTLFGLLNAMGATIPTELWAQILDDGKPMMTSGPKSAERNALSQVSINGHRGATVAMALIVLGELGTTPENLYAVEISIKGLRSVGFNKEARAIAFEVAIAAGL